MDVRTGLAIGLAIALLAGGAEAKSPRTLAEALAAAYASDPTLLAARAQLRATDESVAAALAGWRPQVSFSGSAGVAAGKNESESINPFTGTYVRPYVGTSADRNETSAALTVTQPLYLGGKTKANTHKARNTVMATRAQLIATEQQVFSDTSTAYVNVIQDEQLLALDINNEQVLTKQLQATNDRFRVGEITRTDVAQAEAALAGATATRQTAEGTLQTARATYQQVGRRVAAGQPGRAAAAASCRPGPSARPRRWRRRTTRTWLPRCSTMPRPRTHSTSPSPR